MSFVDDAFLASDGLLLSQGRGRVVLRPRWVGGRLLAGSGLEPGDFDEPDSDVDSLTACAWSRLRLIARSILWGPGLCDVVVPVDETTVQLGTLVLPLVSSRFLLSFFFTSVTVALAGRDLHAVFPSVTDFMRECDNLLKSTEHGSPGSRVLNPFVVLVQVLRPGDSASLSWLYKRITMATEVLTAVLVT